MVVVSYSGKEINAKIVYYGPGLCGKTTNLERIYEAVPAANKGKMISMKTKADRTLFFDFLPLELGDVGGFRTRLMLYTVPGQVFYNATRKLVLKGVDALVFVADSERGKMQENQASLENLRENLESYGMDLDEIPLVFQYNKRDLPSVYTREELDRGLARGERPAVEAVAATGEGVFETLRLVSELLLTRLRARLGASATAPRPREAEAGPAVRPAPAARPLAPAPAPPGPPPAAPRPMQPSLGPAAGPPPMAPPAPIPSPPTPAPRLAEPAAPRPRSPRSPLAEPIPLMRRSSPPSPPEASREAGVDPGLPPAGPRLNPPLEIVRLQSAVGDEVQPSGGEEARSRWGRAVPTPAPAGPAPQRFVVPIELDLDDVQPGECIELVLKIEIGKLRARRQVSG